MCSNSFKKEIKMDLFNHCVFNEYWNILDVFKKTTILFLLVCYN